jgi:hypothetical protein
MTEVALQCPERLSGAAWLAFRRSEVTMECVPASTLPEELEKLGYDVIEIGEGEHILPAAITQQFVIGADGALEPLTEGSTRPIASTVTHAGIVRARRCAFDMP